jgi:hypothetical protein
MAGEQGRVPLVNRKLLPFVAAWTGFAVVVGLLWKLEGTRGLLLNWSWVLVILGVSVFLLVKHHVAIPDYSRAALVVVVGIPALLAVVGGIAVLPQKFQLVGLRVAFLIVVCALPAILWYLFIATRKASLLNEFITSLDRLGLLRAGQREAGGARDRRISSYLERFSAIYGPLPVRVYEDVRAGRFTGYSRTAVANESAGLATTAVPVMAATALIALGWLLTLPPAEVLPAGTADSTTWILAFTPTLQPVTLAFIGAYFFCIQMLFRRYALRDLRGSAYVAVSMRIILATIGVWVLTAVNASTGLLTDGELLAFSFVIGVFPLVVWQFIEFQLKRVAGLWVIGMPSMRAKLPISELDGLTVWHEARLVEHDIENVPNMATADVVDLLLNTRIPPNRLVDWVDQAILETQLGTENKELRKTLHAEGIRTATEYLQAAPAATPSLTAALRTSANLESVLCWRGLCDHVPDAATA